MYTCGGDGVGEQSQEKFFEIVLKEVASLYEL